MEQDEKNPISVNVVPEKVAAQPEKKKRATAPVNKKVKEEKKLAEKEDPSGKRDAATGTNNSQLIMTTITCVTAVCSVFALAFSIYNYNNSAGKITLYSGNDGNSANFTEGSIAEVASKVAPSVVSIKTETRTMSFFGQSSTSSAAGTGMIVSADGYILTNKHVVDGANKISVVLDNGTVYDNVELVGTDPANDVAFIKIKDAKDLPAVKLGDSKTMNVGQQVVAIGNALGQFQNTITEGIVSGLGRSITATDSSYSSYEYLTDLIQTDAAINSGNSGGPLINAAGEVIGINTAVSDGNNIGFAIPISSVKGMLNSILKTGKAERAYIGVSYVTLTPDVAKQYDLSVSTGGYVYNKSGSAVVSGSPAEKAGVKDKDIITAINGTNVGKAGSISALIGEYAVGDTVQLHILRDGKEMNLNVTLAAYPTNNNSTKRQ